MTVRSLIGKLFQQEGLNFLLTNRIPRRLATRFIGWFSKIENPVIRSLSIGVWRLFADLDLSEAKQTQLQEHARLLHARAEGRAPARSIAIPAVLVSPCDAIVGACGAIAGTELVPDQGVALRPGGAAARRRPGRRLPQRPLRHPAPHLEHVPPLPRPARLPRRARDLHLGRHLERQSDRAEARRRSCSARTSARSSRHGSPPPATGSRWSRSPPSWWRASASTSSTRSRTCATWALRPSPAMRPSPRARRWATSSTAPPSSSSRPTAFR